MTDTPSPISPLEDLVRRLRDGVMLDGTEDTMSEAATALERLSEELSSSEKAHEIDATVAADMISKATEDREAMKAKLDEIAKIAAECVKGDSVEGEYLALASALVSIHALSKES